MNMSKKYQTVNLDTGDITEGNIFVLPEVTARYRIYHEPDRDPMGQWVVEFEGVITHVRPSKFAAERDVINMLRSKVERALLHAMYETPIQAVIETPEEELNYEP